MVVYIRVDCEISRAQVFNLSKVLYFQPKTPIFITDLRNFKLHSMSKSYTSLPTMPLADEISFSHPPSLPEIAHLEDSADSVMTDFTNCRPVTIQPAAPLNEAALEMKACNVHMLLVTNKQKKIIGMITTEDLLGEKPLTIAMSRQIKRSEVLVRMIMVKSEHIVTFNYNDLRHAKVGNIVETLHEFKQHYALVVESGDDNKQRVRGIFSLWDLSRRVGKDLTYDVSEAHSLAELQHDLDN